MKSRLIALVILILAVLIGKYAYDTQKHPYKLGLDLNGGTHLVFQADVSKIQPKDVPAAMQSLRDVIERRINVFKVSEPIVQVEQANTGTETIQKLVVELPGVSDTQKAVQIIGQTPSLSFQLIKPAATSSTKIVIASSSASTTVNNANLPTLVSTGLTGQFLKNATVSFDQTNGSPQINIAFNDEGTALFAKITGENIGQPLAIILDGQIISSPVIRDQIRDGKAVISGGFTLTQAKELTRNLNFGALPVPVSLIGSQTIGASLGTDALHKGIQAGMIGFVIIALFLIFWYRLPGVLATISLALYTILNLAIYKLIPVTLTSAGVAGFILSLGMAVDANILIFERMKEELKKGSTLIDSIKEGFARAWTSIRDGNLSSIITSVILYWFATTSLIQGFALVFGLGVIISMFTAITVSRTLLLALAPTMADLKARPSNLTRFMFGGPYKNPLEDSAVLNNSKIK